MLPPPEQLYGGFFAFFTNVMPLPGHFPVSCVQVMSETQRTNLSGLSTEEGRSSGKNNQLDLQGRHQVNALLRMEQYVCKTRNP